MDDSGGVDDRTTFAFGLMTWLGAGGLGGSVCREFRFHENVSQVRVTFIGDKRRQGEDVFEFGIFLDDVKVTEQGVFD